MSTFLVLYSAACVFAAAVVRGYAGFGFSLLSITALSLFLPPAQIIPPIFLLEIGASLHLLTVVWRDIHWRALGGLGAGCLIGTPLGVWLLARIPAAPMTVALALVVLLAAVLLARGWSRQTMPGRTATVATGVVSGALNGSVGLSGPPVVLFFFSSPAGIAVGRATMIAYFLLTDTVGMFWQWRAGLLDAAVLGRALVLVPAMLAGVWLGNRRFGGVDPERFRRWVLRLLMALAVLTGARAIAHLV